MSDEAEQSNEKFTEEMDSLAASLKSYHQAMREEFEIAKNGTSDEIAEKAREKLALLLPEASNQLLTILRKGGKEDAVRLNAVKLVFEYTLGKPAAKSTKEDDVTKLINSLTATDEKEKSETET